MLSVMPYFNFQRTMTEPFLHLKTRQGAEEFNKIGAAQCFETDR